MYSSQVYKDLLCCNFIILLFLGGSKGIGKKIAEQMILRGAKTVSIAARNKNDLAKAKEDLEKNCNGLQTVETYVLDVTESYESIKEVIEKAVETSGPIEILINNAGYVIQGGFSEIPVSSFEAQMRINYLSAVSIFDYFKCFNFEFLRLS